VGELGLRFVATFHLGAALFLSAWNLNRAEQALRAAIALLEGAPVGERFGLAGPAAVFTRAYLAWVLAELGDFKQAIATGEEAVRIAQAAGQHYSEVWARDGLGYAHLRQGNFSAAVAVLKPGLALCRAMDFRAALPFAAAFLGSACAWLDSATDAIPLLEEALEALTEMRLLGVQSWVMTLLAEACLLTGRVVEGQTQAEQIVALAHTHQELGWEAWALKLVGDGHAREPTETEEAADTYQRAHTLATELGMRPLVAHCELGIAKVHLQANQREQARRHLANAGQMYLELDMGFWVRASEAALKESIP
jgi:tetratricopeptide (TPR) repeat protein